MPRGAALAEAAVLMPVLVLGTLGTMQLALLGQARLVVHAAATAAARAAAADPRGTALSPERAAELACLGISGPALPGAARLPARLPGLPGRLAARELPARLKTSADVRFEGGEAVADVVHEYQLLIPGVSRLFVWLPGAVPSAESFRNRAITRLYGSPHARVVGRARIPAPWLAARGVRDGRWPAPRTEGRR